MKGESAMDPNKLSLGYKAFYRGRTYDMPRAFDWLTNDPAIAAKLRAAERTYLAKRETARDLPARKMIQALREAKAQRDAAFRAILGELTP